MASHGIHFNFHAITYSLVSLLHIIYLYYYIVVVSYAYMVEFIECVHLKMTEFLLLPTTQQQIANG